MIAEFNSFAKVIPFQTLKKLTWLYKGRNLNAGVKVFKTFFLCLWHSDSVACTINMWQSYMMTLASSGSEVSSLLTTLESIFTIVTYL